MKLVLVSTFWNSGKYVKDCIESIKGQYYTNFVSYFIDDMSTDDSFEIAKSTIGDDDRFILIKNYEKKYKTKNFIDVIRDNERINWDDVIIELDGDDMLSDNFVLGRINKVFMDRNIWLCGTRWKDRSGVLGNYGKPNPERARTTSWNFSHMRCFRTFLFRQIKDEHLKMNGEYFKGACDIGHAIPMLEMAGSEHFHYINEPLYTYTWHANQSYSESGGIGDKSTQSKTGGYIYRLPRYEKIKLIGEYETKSIDFENIFRIEKIKNERSELSQRLGLGKVKNKKPIDYEKINQVVTKNVYIPAQHIKPTVVNKPDKRQELVELKKNSLLKEINRNFKTKPNRRNNLPNIF